MDAIAAQRKAKGDPCAYATTSDTKEVVLHCDKFEDAADEDKKVQLFAELKEVLPKTKIVVAARSKNPEILPIEAVKKVMPNAKEGWTLHQSFSVPGLLFWLVKSPKYGKQEEALLSPLLESVVYYPSNASSGNILFGEGESLNIRLERNSEMLVILSNILVEEKDMVQVYHNYYATYELVGSRRPVTVPASPESDNGGCIFC